MEVVEIMIVLLHEHFWSGWKQKMIETNWLQLFKNMLQHLESTRVMIIVPPWAFKCKRILDRIPIFPFQKICIFSVAIFQMCCQTFVFRGCCLCIVREECGWLLDFGRLKSFFAMDKCNCRLSVVQSCLELAILFFHAIKWGEEELCYLF